MRPSLADVRDAAVSLTSLVLLTLAYVRWLQVSNAPTVALTFLLLVLVTAATSRLAVAVVTSVVAMLCFNFFFLPPVGTWTIADPQNWVALFVFLAVSLIASRLSDVARARTGEAEDRRDELARLFDLSRDVLAMDATPDAVSHLARAIARRFALDLVVIALPAASEWSLSVAGEQPTELDATALTEALDAARRTLEFDAYTRTYAGHRSVTADGQIVRLVPLRVGTRPIGILAAGGRPVEAGTLDTLAGVVAIAIERMRFLEERKVGELTRQSEQLKTALLASLGHDLRTPLTAIRVAASNLKAEWLTEREREDQGDLVLQEVERLTRLFANVLEMARIDAGGIMRTPQWTHPSEIVAAARDQVAESLKLHQVATEMPDDDPIQLDARLTASALAHVLENAAQYSPEGSRIDVGVTRDATSLRISVRDHGPGLAVADVPHLFDRFYRGGTATRQRSAGSGMGLWIARELLAAERGRVWAENCADGGSRFTLEVPCATSTSHQDEAAVP